MPRTTKLQRQQMKIDELIKRSLMAVGLYMSNNYIFDQDTNLPWMFKNKIVKFPQTCKNIPIHCNEVIFHPLFSKQMVKDLFDIGIAKAIQYDDLYVKAIAPEITDKGKNLVLYRDQDIIKTTTYEHEVMIYYEMMFLIADMLTEEVTLLLHEIDDMLNGMIPKKKSNRRKVLFNAVYD